MEAANARTRLSRRDADDLDLIHRELMAVIDESPHYNERFKAHEKARLTKASCARCSGSTPSTSSS